MYFYETAISLFFFFLVTFILFLYQGVMLVTVFCLSSLPLNCFRNIYILIIIIVAILMSGIK